MQGSILGIIKGDTRNLDYELFGYILGILSVTL